MPPTLLHSIHLTFGETQEPSCTGLFLVEQDAGPGGALQTQESIT